MVQELDPFPQLPEELVKLILECATEPDSSAETAPAPADIQTLLSLLLVSRATYNLLIPRLYRSVSISRPSQLIAFTATLLHRPALGLLVRNLWVGSLDNPIDLVPFVVNSNVPLILAAKDHILRWERLYSHSASPSVTERIARHRVCRDLVYLENGAEESAMHVPSLPVRLSPPQHTASERAALEEDIFNRRDTWVESRSFSGFGVDKDSDGYDAAGDWIGMDEWMLRCIELQNMIEFHYEWIAHMLPEEQVNHSKDDEAKAGDPLDWTDAHQPPTPLPSVLQRQRELSDAGTSTSADVQNSLGFEHLNQFIVIRQRGYSTRAAAEIIIDGHIRRLGLPARPMAALDTLQLLRDSDEGDHFSHPALFARSGAVELIIGSELPEGNNAPPNAIPASAAVLSAFGNSSHSSDESSDSDGELAVGHRANGHGMTVEGRQRVRERSVLDFADLYGHVSHNSRILYRGTRGGRSEGGITMELDQTPQPTSTLQKRSLTESDKGQKRPLPTLGSLLATLRACLSFCPRIRVLGLNGFLERAVAGTRNCVGLSELRHLSLGPPPPYWSSALHLHQSMLSSVRTLHISGCMLFKSEAMAIGGYTLALPSLREVDWTLWLAHVLEHPINVTDTLSYMLGKEPHLPSTVGETVKRKRPLRQVRATLNAADVAFWKQNTREEVRNEERLVLRECGSKDQDANIRSVREWWERKAGIRSEDA